MQRRASVMEIVGAWLHIWVPPRDVEVPPVPWRKLAIWTGVGAVVLAAALVVLVPRITESKSERAAKAAAQARAARIRNRDRVIHLQQPRHAVDAALKRSGDSGPAARAALLQSVEAAILADARARAAKGELRPVSGPTTCSPVPGTPVGRPLGTFDCFTVTRTIQSTSKNVAGAIGYPFRAVVDFANFSYTWCRTEQFPGEMLIPNPSTVVRLPPACRAT